jgi:hypothetical protein
VDSVDDLGVVDTAQVHGRDRQIGMSELALNDQQRDALARHLNGVRVAQLMGRGPSSHPGTSGCVIQLGTDPGRRPRPSAGQTAQDTEQATNRELAA